MRAPVPPPGPTAGPPAPPSAPRSATAVLAAVLAGCLTLASVLGVGWWSSANQRASRGSTSVSGTLSPSGSWTHGTKLEWSSVLGLGMELLAAGERVVTVQRTQARDTNTILTAYKVTSSGLEDLWSTTVDLSKGTPNPSWASSSAPNYEFLVWGDTLVHGTTLINLDNGTASTAPWPENDIPLIAGDTAISCTAPSSASAATTCTAWKAGSEEPLWTIEAPNAGLMPGRGYIRVENRQAGRYVILSGSTVVNLDTGQKLPLGSGKGLALSAADGWLVYRFASKDGDKPTLDAFTLDGTAADSYQSSLDDTPIPSQWGALSLAQIKGIWTGAGRAPAYIGLDDASGCITRITFGSGAVLQAPELAQKSSLDSTDQRCVFTVTVSNDNSVLVTRSNDLLANQSIAGMYATADGEEITFEGIDPKTDDTLMMITPELLLGYDPDTGRLSCYGPKA